jgi:hypothetical protein
MFLTTRTSTLETDVNHDRFDTLLGSLATAPSRRKMLRLLAGSTFSGLLTLGARDAFAKKGGNGKRKGKGRKVTICHQEQTITVAKSALKGHKKHGDTVGPCPSAPPPGAVLTYQCPGPKTNSLSGDGANRFAQTFIAERSGSLQQIQFSINKKPNTTGDYLVQLLKVVGGKPSHSPTDVLAALTVPDAAVATSSDATLTATFAGPALVAGNEYAAAFSRPGTGPGGVGANNRKGDGSACGGNWFIADGAGPFNEAVAQDLLVSVLVT